MMQCLLTDKTHFLVVYFCFPRDYESLRKEDVLENNRLVRGQLVEPFQRKRLELLNLETRPDKHSRFSSWQEVP